MEYIKDAGDVIKSIGGSDSLSTTAVTVAVNGCKVTVKSLTGNVWLSPLGTAVADETAWQLEEGEDITLVVPGTLSLISNGDGATYQYIIWRG